MDGIQIQRTFISQSSLASACSSYAACVFALARKVQHTITDLRPASHLRLMTGERAGNLLIHVSNIHTHSLCCVLWSLDGRPKPSNPPQRSLGKQQRYCVRHPGLMQHECE